MGLKENLEELAHRNEEALQGGGPERIKRQHELGKFTARERVELLLDPGSFAWRRPASSPQRSITSRTVSPTGQCRFTETAPSSSVVTTRSMRRR